MESFLPLLQTSGIRQAEKEREQEKCCEAEWVEDEKWGGVGGEVEEEEWSDTI